MQLSKDQKIVHKLSNKDLLSMNILSFLVKEQLKAIKEFKNKKKEWLEVEEDLEKEVEEVIEVEEVETEKVAEEDIEEEEGSEKQASKDTLVVAQRDMMRTTMATRMMRMTTAIISRDVQVI